MTTDIETPLFPRVAGQKPRVVIVGCGFGGLEAAHHLVKYDVDLVLIDRTNHHLFQPLLYQVSTAALSPADIASPVRALLGKYPNVSVILGEVTGVDKVAREVFVRDTGSIPYDYLLLATGSVYAWFGHDEWSKHAATLKTLPDALQIRRRILESFDWAESRRDPAEVKALTSFVIIGGGPTGVELAGSLGELAKSTLKSEYRHIDPSQARIVLVDAAPRILLEFPEKLSAYAARALE
ncbi:NAD(P)/FAD-dependent oxidoreductase, partial [Beijerinckia sp. L45]|uniref:NAD(P)/FAD-dependent oxidoreductase n=1 Tax=Beijerinckia sp. L45 TaxID=1641855 RepID=UPI00131AF0AE